MNKDYWDDIYWEKHLKKDNLNDIEDFWITKYESFLPNSNIKILDLGCGVGQYATYFYYKGYQVTATDISSKALEYLKGKNSDIQLVLQDMSKPLKFKDNEFDIVFANLSIHFFSEEETKNSLLEIKRILRLGGLFIGSVNSTSAYEYIKDHVVEIEENFYNSNGRTVRLWDEKSFQKFFKDFKKLSLNEVIEERFNKQKNKWEFVYKK